ncbi:nucleolar pre-ribosomal-associated protein 1-like [Centruroides sculpturatus]|uniref:nucleolar pre-ribosomal-associated protein 1-like n=1 Tax=Centruroides sculpturatus TaxID=218467 RepID=UPI000C6EC26B|nr:nucleolar pre-ribosomal-associated protein 1-like [Centruroides sculpturatus]
MDSNSLSENLTEEMWSSLVKKLLRKGLNDLSNGYLMIELLNSIISTVYKINMENMSLSLPEIFQMIFGHSNFISLILEDSGKCLTKESIISLLVTLVTLDSSVCKSEHIPLYLGAYHATLNKTDQSLLFLISLYEEAGIQLNKFRPFMWGSAGVNHYSLKAQTNLSLWKEPNLDDIITLLDREKMWHTILNFPLNLDLKPGVQELKYVETELDKIYDPRFLLSLFIVLLTPGSLVNCRKFIESKCLALIFTSLSSSVLNIRKAGYYVLHQFYEHLEGSRFKEKDLWLGILKLMKHNITKSNIKLSYLVTLFLCKVTDYAFKSGK